MRALNRYACNGGMEERVGNFLAEPGRWNLTNFSLVGRALAGAKQQKKPCPCPAVQLSFPGAECIVLGSIVNRTNRAQFVTPRLVRYLALCTSGVILVVDNNKLGGRTAQRPGPRVWVRGMAAQRCHVRAGGWTWGREHRSATHGKHIKVARTHSW